MIFKDEKEMVMHILNKDIKNRFFNINSVVNEYGINGKRVDIRVINNGTIHNLIECKMELNPYDIGQLLSYGTMYYLTFNIKPNLFLYVNTINHHLETIIQMFKLYNIDINLIDYSYNKIYNLYSSYNKQSNLTFIDGFNNLENRYIDYAKENKSYANQLPSYKQIAKHLNISERKAKNIHNYLIEKRIIRTENNKSYLIDNQGDSGCNENTTL